MGVNPMSVMLIAEIPGFTQEQYDAVSKELGSQDASSESLKFHAAGPIEGGWQIVEIWNSVDDYREFTQSHLKNAFVKLDVSGIPTVRVVPIYSLHK
jgi:hypothetical protein